MHRKKNIIHQSQKKICIEYWWLFNLTKIHFEQKLIFILQCQLYYELLYTQSGKYLRKGEEYKKLSHAKLFRNKFLIISIGRVHFS